ncbi:MULTISPECIES: hypothetical protein [Prochlorococcus]|uniref:hypothetical protein n=1 Tax=Prochlorococcus TaxID=1218 RepID=UPI00053372C8|nr:MULTISPECIES: hypothetical protein [Prochlorococcus]KGG12357.1 hypothetical protein EV05_1568 [Prochlorococcus sp. MIT 0601]
MPTFELLDLNPLTEIAKVADLCFKPWKHSVVDISTDDDSVQNDQNSLDLIVIIECRDVHGIRFKERDLECEIFRSGNDLSITLSSSNSEEAAILWQGRHPVWMDPTTGKRCHAPQDNPSLEAFTRRLRSLFLLERDN